jgi:hypothetical protein
MIYRAVVSLLCFMVSGVRQAMLDIGVPAGNEDTETGHRLSRAYLRPVKKTDFLSGRQVF